MIIIIMIIIVYCSMEYIALHEKVFCGDEVTIRSNKDAWSAKRSIYM